MAADSPRNCICHLDIGARRHQREVRPLEAGEICNGRGRNAVVIFAAIVQSLKLEAVSAALPFVSIGWNVL